MQPGHADEGSGPHDLDRPEPPALPLDLGVDHLGQSIALGPGALAQPLDHERMGVERGERLQVVRGKRPEEQPRRGEGGGHRLDGRARQPAQADSACSACSAAQR